MPALPIGDCIKFGWETFKKRPWILIGAILLVYLICSIPNLFMPHPQLAQPGVPQEPLSTSQTITAIVAGLVAVAVSLLAQVGMTHFSLRAHDDIEKVEIGDLWYPAPIWRFIGAILLMFLVVFVGVLLLMIPVFVVSLISQKLGLIVGVPLILIPLFIVSFAWMFVPYLIVDRDLGPMRSLKESWRITEGNRWRLFLLWLALIGVILLGAIALIVGLLVAIPVCMLALVHAYRFLQSAAGPAPA